jgi:hypothetical protein
MGIKETLQKVFREPDEEDMIQELIRENKRLRAEKGIYQTDDIPQNEEGANQVIKDVAIALVLWERAKGRISADYTLLMLAKALDETGKKYYTKNKNRIFSEMGPILDSQVEIEVQRSRQYDEYLKQKRR